jgi:hypothetical protein
MEPKDTKRLLIEGDPLRDAEAVATRLLAIDEAERVREMLRGAGIACQLRLIKQDDVRSPTSDPLLLSSYSTLRPSWNVFVAADDLAGARAIAEERLRTDLDGRDDTQETAGGRVRERPVPLCTVAWHDAWAIVERLGRAGIEAAVDDPLGDGPLEERQASVLVLPADLEAAKRWIGPVDRDGTS